MIRFRPSPFRPAAWLPGAHAQTIAGRYLRRPAGVRYMRERVETPDGDFIDLDHASVDGLAADAPLAIVVHGLEGSANSSYVLETCRALAEHGIRAVAYNFRSCSGSPNRAPRLYHAGETGDLGFLVELLRAREPGTTLLSVGFSLGGNVLLKYLGEQGPASHIRAAVAVSVPFDLALGARHLAERLMGRFYTRVFLRQLRRKYSEKRHQLEHVCDPARVAASRTFWEFDDAATAPIHGFAGADDYYSRSSSAGYLHAIRVPTLLIQAEDDPFIPPGAIPREAVASNPFVTLALTSGGGHVGFIGGTPWRLRFWAETEAARFLRSALTLAPRDTARGAGAGMPSSLRESTPDV